MTNRRKGLLLHLASDNCRAPPQAGQPRTVEPRSLSCPSLSSSGSIRLSPSVRERLPHQILLTMGRMLFAIILRQLSCIVKGQGIEGEARVWPMILAMIATTIVRWWHGRAPATNLGRETDSPGADPTRSG